MTSSLGTYTLELQEVMQSDAGEYTARASNALGVTEAKCIVRVNRKSRHRQVFKIFFSSVNYFICFNYWYSTVLTCT